MLKKTVLVLFAVLMGGVLADAHEEEFKLINHLRYYKTMYDAHEADELMRIPYGLKPENVGGEDQDSKKECQGVPMAFRPTENSDEVWILDSINRGLKLFKSGKLLKHIKIKQEMGFISDFAFNKKGKIALLNQNVGNVYIINDNGNLIKNISGFQCANSLEFVSENTLLIDSPLSHGKVKLSIDGDLLGVYESDQTLSVYSSEKGVWGLDCYGGQVAKLFVRPNNGKTIKVIAEFPYKDYEDVEYKGGNIYGFDKDGNIYFGLVACNPEGIIYRDRIYKCNQNGKVLKEIDVLSKPFMSPNLPRHRVACPDGRVLTFHSFEDNYYLYTYSMK